MYGHTDGCMDTSADGQTDAQSCLRTFHNTVQPNEAMSTSNVSDSLFKANFLLLKELEKY